MKMTVEEFLGRFKTVLEFGPLLWHDDIRRAAEMADLGVTRNQVVEELKNLALAHHHRGPEPDDAEVLAASALHIFRMQLKGTSTFVYVKVSLVAHPKKKSHLTAKIWSFKRWS